MNPRICIRSEAGGWVDLVRVWQQLVVVTVCVWCLYLGSSIRPSVRPCLCLSNVHIDSNSMILPFGDQPLDFHRSQPPSSQTPCQ
jgi:hypothetical protein